ncbi:hypothetical protein ACFOD9_00960 [Novosphingobium bradum]|uniref:SMP-30/Gluconolactonase/LRE-like region domain-containing protein n=1 Tax=Novosphingobium bradum TaxID=1737444 RepID=A0ABV7IPN9_9SPHN
MVLGLAAMPASAATAPVGTSGAATVEACGESLPAPGKPAGPVKALCGFNLPEDMAMTPDGRHVLVGDLGMVLTPTGVKMPDRPTDIAVLDTTTDKVGKLVRTFDKGPNWGDPACPARGPDDKFLVIGLSVGQRAHGVVQLLVVNPMGGEHVEFYELQRAGGGGLSAAWRGCVMAPADGTVDAVSPMPDGGFVASVICAKSLGGTAPCTRAGLAGGNTGWLLAWSPGGAVRRLANSDAALNNGLVASADGREVYMVATGTNALRVYSLRQQRYVRDIALGFRADNAHPGPGGTVLTGGTIAGNLCLGLRAKGCVNQSRVASVNPRSGRVTILFSAGDGLLSGTTAGLIAGRSLYVSSLSDPFLLKARLRR